MNMQNETEYNQAAVVLETALNRKAGKFTVQLRNVGNPDYRQDCTRPLPETTCGWAAVDTLKEAVQLCRMYISFYDLGGGNWSGGLIHRIEDGVIIGKVAYNGRIFAGAKWFPGVKEIIP